MYFEGLGDWNKDISGVLPRGFVTRLGIKLRTSESVTLSVTLKCHQINNLLKQNKKTKQQQQKKS